jgi:hypothetical protein
MRPTPPFSGRPLTALDIANAGGDAVARDQITSLTGLFGQFPTPAILSKTIRQNTSINLFDFADFASMIAWIKARSVDGDFYISAFLPAGTLAIDQLIWDYEFGDRVKFFGQGSGSTTLVFDNTGNKSGIFCTRPLGFINGLTVKGVGGLTATRGVWLANSYGGGIVTQGSGARALVGSDVKVNSFYYGLLADKGGSMFVSGGVEVALAGDVGFHAREGSYMLCANTKCLTASDVGNGQTFGSGHNAELGSSMDCSGASASDCQVAGVVTSGGSAVWAQGYYAANNVGNGAVSFGGYLHLGYNYVLAKQTQLTGNQLGAACYDGGHITMPHPSGKPMLVLANRGDGLLASGVGSSIEGSNVAIENNGGYGAHADRTGLIHMFVAGYGTAAKANTLGTGYVGGTTQQGAAIYLD